jgi:hypothetical protein
MRDCRMQRDFCAGHGAGADDACCELDRQPGVSKGLREVSWQNCAGAAFWRAFACVEKSGGAASADELRGTIANGKSHMPKFGGKLTPEQIDALVEEIRAVNRK